MSESSGGLHEAKSDLGPETVDRHRAIASLMEELQAIDWYEQRVQATQDETLGAILAHNRDEEKEHAAMLLEWLRRHDPALDGELRTYLFRDGDITTLEGAGAEGADDTGSTPPRTTPDGSLGIGDMGG